MPPAKSRSFLSFARAVPAAEDQPTLYCFAYAGGSGSQFAPWARALAQAVTILGVEMPGHGSRFQESPLDNVSAMAAVAADAIGSANADTSFAFYGHSLGAVVAFETARILMERGDASKLRHLFVGAARAPQLPPLMPSISHLPTDQFLDAVQRRYGGLPAVLFEEPELLEIVLPVLRADFNAYETYRYDGVSPLDCPITAFYGTGDVVVQAAAVNEWSKVTRGSFRIEPMPGDHFFLNTCQDALLQVIKGSFVDAVTDSTNSSQPHLSA